LKLLTYDGRRRYRLARPDRGTLMTDAYIIEAAGETAGIVVRERRGVRFFASEPRFYVLDGKIFASAQAAHRAVGALRQSRSSPKLQAAA
jgi:hypothetical protein